MANETLHAPAIEAVAKAKHVRISLGEADDWLQLSIRDDGQGFNPDGVGSGHHGLLGMRYRIESLGGTLQLLSAPGRGTLVLARLPLREEPQPEPAPVTAPGELGGSSLS